MLLSLFAQTDCCVEIVCWRAELLSEGMLSNVENDCPSSLLHDPSLQQEMHATTECFEAHRTHKPVMVVASVGPFIVISMLAVFFLRRYIYGREQGLSTKFEQQYKMNVDVESALPMKKSSGFWLWRGGFWKKPPIAALHVESTRNSLCLVQRADEKYDGLESTRNHLVKMLFSHEVMRHMAHRSSAERTSYIGRSSSSIALQVEITSTVVGRGDYGVVRVGIMRSPDYLAADKPKRVAVKQMEAARLPQANRVSTTEALQHELKVLQRIKLHKNVVRFYGGWVEPNGQVNIIEELLHGNLADLIHDPEKMARCTYAQLLQIFLDIVGGVLHLHASNIIHHDLKPSNVLLNQSCTQAKISDFGCSRLKPRTLMNASLVGTVGYLPLECLMSFLKIPVQPEKIDVFSLGVIMWESITGETPPNPFMVELTLDAGNEKGSVQGSELSSLSGLSDSGRYPFSPNVPVDLSILIWSCLSLEVSERPSLKDVREHLKKIRVMPWSNEVVRP